MSFAYDRPELPGRDDPAPVPPGRDFFRGVPGCVPTPGTPPTAEWGWVYPGNPSAPAQLPTPQYSGYHVIHKGILYVIAGWGVEGYDLTRSVRTYDPATDSWGTAPDLGADIACYYPTSAASVGDWIYVHDDYDMLFYRYNPDTGVTESLTPSNPDPWNGIYDSGLVVLDGLIYRGLASMTGGRVYDPQVGSWSNAPGPRPPEANYWAWESCAALGNSIIVSVDSYVWQYTPSTGEWVELAESGGFPRNRFPATTVVVDDVIWRLGNDSGGASVTFERYNPDIDEWEREDFPEGIPNVEAFGAVAFPEGPVRILCWGGYDRDTWTGVGGRDIGTTWVWGWVLAEGNGSEECVPKTARDVFPKRFSLPSGGMLQWEGGSWDGGLLWTD